LLSHYTFSLLRFLCEQITLAHDDQFYVFVLEFGAGVL
jgi:hypothetical protein